MMEAKLNPPPPPEERTCTVTMTIRQAPSLVVWLGSFQDPDMPNEVYILTDELDKMLRSLEEE